MVRIMFSIMLYIVEFLIAFRYFKNTFEFKNNYKFSFIVSASCYCILLIAYIVFPNLEWFNVLLFAIFNYAAIKIGFVSKQTTAIFHTFILTLIMYVTEMITIFTISTLFNKSVMHYQDDFFLLIVDAVICKMLYFVFLELIMLIQCRNNKQIDRGKYWILIIMPICSMCCILLIHYLLTQVEVSSFIGFVSSLLTILLLSANVLVFWIYENMQIKNNQILELQMENQKSNLDLSYLKLLEQKNNSSDELIHDIKNHLLTINSIADSDEVSLYIENVYGKVDKYSYIGKTSNKMLDLILNKYTTICKNKDICFYIEAFSENLVFINDVDLSILLNNLLDNSVESAEKCSNKNIELILKRNENGCHIIDLKNSCENKPKIKNHNFLSTKSESNYHGIGTKNIEKIVKKYNGEIEWQYDEKLNVFQVIIIF